MLIETILKKYDIEYTPTKNNTELRIRCPNPKHIDKNPSCYINNITGKFYCFSCGFKGNLARFIKLITGKYIKIEDLISQSDYLSIIIKSIYKESEKNILKYDIDNDFKDYIREIKPYIISPYKSRVAINYLKRIRNLSDNIIKQYKLSYCRYGDYKNRIIIPYYKNKELIGFNSRYIGKDENILRYLYFVNDIKFDGYIYNLENIKNRNYCIIVEGPFDLMYMVQNGFKNTISTLNTNLSESHLLHISEFKNIIFCYDNDIETKAGQKARIINAKKILSILPNKNVYFMDLPEGKDPNDCTKEQLIKSFKNAYKIKRRD